MEEDKVYYVYEHLNRKGQCFYIGKGKDKRGYSSANRNDDWWEEVLQDGEICFTVNILKSDMSEEDSYRYESNILEDYGIESLTNRVKGHDWKRKISKTLMNHIVTPETREKVAIALSGKGYRFTSPDGDILEFYSRRSVMEHFGCSKHFTVLADRGLIKKKKKDHSSKVSFEGWLIESFSANRRKLEIDILNKIKEYENTKEVHSNSEDGVVRETESADIQNDGSTKSGDPTLRRISQINNGTDDGDAGIRGSNGCDKTQSQERGRLYPGDIFIT